MSKSKKELSFAEEVEQSLRKKFRKNIWCKFTKAINEYELSKTGRQNCCLYFRRKRFYVAGKAFSRTEAS